MPKKKSKKYAAKNIGQAFKNLGMSIAAKQKAMRKKALAEMDYKIALAKRQAALQKARAPTQGAYSNLDLGFP